MGYSVFPAAAGGKTMYKTTLLSGTSWTVPAGVTYVNVTLFGGGGGGGGVPNAGSLFRSSNGFPGQVISSTLSTTPGASIAYAIGAGGTGGSNGLGGVGGTTTFTGATSATGGNGGIQGGNSSQNSGPVGTTGGAQWNGGGLATNINTSGITGGTGGAGKIDIEYWA